MTPSMFTGSYVYGKPNNDSDVDIVLLVNAGQLKTLRRLADKSLMPANNTESDGTGEISAASLRFGRINLIAVTDPVMFAVWEKGTNQLAKKRPVTRRDAISHFRALRSLHLRIKNPEDNTAKTEAF